MLALVLAGCGGQVSVVKNTPPAQKPVVKDATREELLEKFNSAAGSINSLNATVELKPTAGSKYSGIIEEYHEVKAFLLAERPAKIRVIGQAPVIGTTVFDMASDSQEFRVSIPSKNKFLIAPAANPSKIFARNICSTLFCGPKFASRKPSYSRSSTTKPLVITY